jgi:hypothetical protein
MLKILFTIFTSILLTGCFSNKSEVNNEYAAFNNTVKKAFKENTVLPYDEIVDRGQYAEVWIAPYKDEDDNLFNERRMNFWVVKPDFLVGEELPKSKKITIVEQKPFGNFNVNPKEPNKFTIDKEVIEYLNENKEDDKEK